uniref:Tetraspanin n=2 Tax=Nyssomyia neivai TaxID=330878 RepID=A0A1L8DJV0_9DIPT
MAGKGRGQGENAAKLENQIACIKYTIFCFNICAWMVAAALFALTVWIRAEPGFADWVDILQIHAYYIGIYILIGVSIIVMISSFLGCCSALMEHTVALYMFIGTQGFCFLFGTIGAAVLLSFSTIGSFVQPLIWDTITRLIMASSHHQPSRDILKMIQESVGCCGADGPNDYIVLKHPLPRECRDSVTGNAFFHGCVDELTWFLEDKSGWVAGLAMALALMHVINGVMSMVLVQALKKEEDEARTYRH